MRLNSVHCWPRRNNPTLEIKKEGQEIVEDFFCLKIGYCSHDCKTGESVYIKASDAKFLWEILKGEYGK
jgi:hypothetical protein